MIEITDANDSRIGLYRNLKEISFSQSEKKLFVAEGSIVLQKLLRSNIKIFSIFALPDYYNLFSDLIKSKNISPENQFTTDKKIMNDIVGYRLHQGIMAICEIPAPTDILNLKTPIVVMNGIINSENVGAIVRNAVAFGVNSIVFDKTTSHLFLRRAVRVSMGTVFSTQYFPSENLLSDLILLKSRKEFEIIASEINDKSKPIDSCHFNKDCVIIFGNEGNGISKEILNVCDKIIHITISKEVESLNVAASSAIILNQIRKHK